MASANVEGIVTLRSHHSVDQTVRRLEEMLQARGIQRFLTINQSEEAARAGLTMRPTQLVLFGNPKAGTLLMVAAPAIALDLPLKVLVAEDPEGQVWVSYYDPDYLLMRYGLPEELRDTLAAAGALAKTSAE